MSRKDDVQDQIKRVIEEINWLLECPEDALGIGVDAEYLDTIASRLSHLCLVNLELTREEQAE